MNQTIDIFSQTFEYQIVGNGSPTIVFLNGNGMNFKISWEKVVESIKDSYTCFQYNRDGIGKTSRPKIDQTGDIVVGTVMALLENLNLQPPLILVGHSSGGLLANLIARLYPDKIAGIVFVDSSHPEQFKLKIPKGTFLSNLLLKTICLFKRRNEISHFDKIESLVNDAGIFPQVPTYVLTGTKLSLGMSKESMEEWKGLQRKLCCLSQINSHVMSDKSSHFISYSEPDLVVQAIEWVVKETGLRENMFA